MWKRKKMNPSFVSEVDDSRQIVYDFRRRTQYLFENYRAVAYKKRYDYDMVRFTEEDEKMLGDLVVANAVDSGNADCLVGQILGPVRDGFIYLDDQAIEHLDFYSRQGSNMEAHHSDISRILSFWREKEASMVKEHEYTTALWNRYRRYKQGGEGK